MLGVTFRRGATDTTTKVLLLGILIVLLALVFLVVSQRPSVPPEKAAEIASQVKEGSQSSTVSPQKSDDTTSQVKVEKPKETAQSIASAATPQSEVQGKKPVPGSNAPVAVRAGQTVSRPPEVPPPPPSVGRPDRIREILQEGKTYEVILSLDMHGPVREKEWGLQTTVSLAYRAEMDLRRTIKKNDGTRVVELRELGKCRIVKATSKLENIQFVYTEPGTLLFGAIGAGVGLLDAYLTGGVITQLAAAVVVRAIQLLPGSIQKQLDDHNTKVQAMLDSLSGKTVQITYVDGMGVAELVPVGCTLTQEERDFLFTSAVVGDAFLLPDVESKPGDMWEVEGAAFADLLPPSWRSVPRGKIVIRRENDFEKDGKKFARLRCSSGTLQVDATDASRTRLATFTPRGYLIYNITDGHIQEAELAADIAMHEASRDHLLFESRFETQPRVRTTYFCRIMDSR